MEIPSIKIKDKKYLLNYIKRNIFVLLLLYVIFIVYIILTIIYPAPYGTDVYTHLIYTLIMSKTNYIYDFYKYCFYKGYLGYDYPFGLWLFGSIAMKIAKLNSYELALVLPFYYFIITILLYYVYCNELVSNKNNFNMRLLSIIFLITAPFLSLNIINYSPSKFIMSILILTFYILINENIKFWKKILLLNLSVLTICLTHTGTYLFLSFFVILYLFIYSIYMGKFNKESYILLILITVYYMIVASNFPYVQSHYIGKGRILLSIGKKLSFGYFSLPNQLTEIIYTNIIVKPNIVLAIIFSLSLFTVAYFAIFLHNILIIIVHKIKKYIYTFSVFWIKHLSHTVTYWPIWIGPVQFVLGLFGLRGLNKKGLCLLLAVAIVVVISGKFAGERALRELFYFFIIFPILSAIGFLILKDKLAKIDIKNKYVKKVLVFSFTLITFCSITVIPVIGKLYYHPLIAGQRWEIDCMKWLSKIGTPEEGATGTVGPRLALYSNKIPVEVTMLSPGSETVRFNKEKFQTFFSHNSENATMDLLSTYNVKYFILTKKIFRLYNRKLSDLTIDNNTQLDKIYSSIDYTSIYSQIPPKTKRVDIHSQIDFEENVTIKDAGGLYLVVTPYYKVRLSKDSPKILYIGNRSVNYLGEGSLVDFIIVTVLVRGTPSVVLALEELTYDQILLGKNQIIYKTVLKNNRTNLATLIVKYTFFQKAFKREIIVANDWIDKVIEVKFGTQIVAPLNHFTIEYEGKVEKRTIYPCDDYVLLKDKKFKEMYIYSDEKTGILFQYEDTSLFPSRILYQGYTGSYEGYSLVYHTLKKQLYPFDCVHVTQWIAIGDSKIAHSNINWYRSISLYPFPNGKLPLIILSYAKDIDIDTVNDIMYVYKKLKRYGVDSYTLVVSGSVEGNALEILRSKNIEVINDDKISLMGNDIHLIFRVVPPPFYIYYKEGLRKIQSAYINGNKTSTVLIPISGPIVTEKTRNYPSIKTLYDVIDTAVRCDDPVILRFDYSKLRDPEILNLTIDTVRYAKIRGLTLSTIDEIVNHYVLLQNVSAKVSLNEGRIEITIKNNNSRSITGLTFKIKVEGDWTVKNCKIVKLQRSGIYKIYYISIDIKPNDQKTIILERIK